MKSIWDEAYNVAAGCEQAFMQTKGFESAKLLIRDAMLQAYIAALTGWAWWKDGVQYVGSCGVTLEEAIKNARKDAGL